MIDIFVQGEGIPEITLLQLSEHGKVRDILAVAQESGLSLAGDEHSLLLLLENTEDVLAFDLLLEEAHIGHRSRVHVHRCRRLEVMVNFNGAQRMHAFSSATTIEQVQRWVVGKDGFNLPALDATEHLLQLCSSSDRPDDDTHIGALVQFPTCGLCFDLVPKVRVEG